MKNLSQNSKAYYEDNDYYELFSLAEDDEKKIANYLDNISKNKIILDAGCGTGKYLNVLENNSIKYIGIDLSSNQLAKAKNKSSNNNSIFICSNLSKIPIDSNSIDLIVSAWVLGTITDTNERIKTLNELKRVLKQNGQIILIENAEHSEFEQIRGRDKDTRTRDYNNWILNNGFILDNMINTYFKFKTYQESKKCFEIIYGSDVSLKVKSKIIEHKINIYKYKSNL